MKKIKLIEIIALTVISLNGYAQTIVAPHNSDVGIAKPLKAGYMNNALIDYSPNCPGGPGACGIAQFSAIALDTNNAVIPGRISFLYINDGINPIIQDTIHGERPDIIVGNSTTTPSDYMVGVVYTKPSTCTADAGDIYLSVYEYNNIGGTGGPSLVSKNIYLISDGKSTCRAISHIDILAQSSNLLPSGQPLCNQFAITFSDTTKYLPTGCGYPPGTVNPEVGINIYWASFTNPGSGTAVADPYTTNNIPEYFHSDVAAVERKGTSGYYNVAIYTYVDKNNVLYQNEWQESTSSPSSSPIVLDNNMYSLPRIDGIDNYSFNDPSGSNAYYVVTDMTTAATPKVYEYNNIASGPILISGFGKPDFLPSVTNGLNENYTIGYYTHDGVDEMLTKEISWATGLPNSTNYYRVNLQSILYTTNEYFTAINATCNTNLLGSYKQYIFPSWVNKGTLFEKIEPAITAFKSTGVNTVNNETSWKVVPNPATNYVMLFTSLNNVTGYGYTVSDITGRILLKAALSSNNEQIDISKLTSGMYLLNIKNGTDCVKTMKIIKE